MSCGEGAHGPRDYDWAAATIRPWREPGWDHWLPARRSPADGQIAYYVCFSPAGTTLQEPARVAGSRWMVEECFQTAKSETGLDHYQVRGYTAGIAMSPCPWPRWPSWPSCGSRLKRGSRDR